MESDKPIRFRSEIQRVRDRGFIADLYCKGITQQQIAEQLRIKYYEGVMTFSKGKTSPFKISRNLITKEIKIIQEDWTTRYSGEIEKHKQLELAKIDHLERVAWDAWEKSWSKRKIDSVKKISVPSQNKFKKQLEMIEKIEGKSTSEERLGDPRYLDIVKWCIDRRCEILNIFRRQKIDIDGSVGESLTVTFSNFNPVQAGFPPPPLGLPENAT